METLETLDQLNEVEILFSEEPDRDPTVTVATVVLAATALVAVAAWKSGYGRKIRNMLASAIKAD